MYRGVLLAASKWTIPVPQKIWKSQLIKMARLMKKELSFITVDHRRVHRCMINHLTETGTPCRAEILAGKLNLPVERVNTLLDEIEEHINMFKREAGGDIMETYPVTLKKTPMRMVISTGHELYAGEALGALAMPWIQKRVHGTSISGHITTECAYCKRPLHMLVDSDATVKVIEENIDLMIFAPAPVMTSSLADIARRFTNARSSMPEAIAR